MVSCRPGTWNSQFWFSRPRPEEILSALAATADTARETGNHNPRPPSASPLPPPPANHSRTAAVVASSTAPHVLTPVQRMGMRLAVLKFSAKFYVRTYYPRLVPYITLEFSHYTGGRVSQSYAGILRERVSRGKIRPLHLL